MTTRTSMRVAMAGKKGRTRVGVWLRTAMDGSGITATDEGTALGAVPFGVEDVPPVFGGVTGFTTLTAFDFFIMDLLLMRRDCRIFWRSHRHGLGVGCAKSDVRWRGGGGMWRGGGAALGGRGGDLAVGLGGRGWRLLGLECGGVYMGGGGVRVV